MQTLARAYHARSAKQLMQEFCELEDRDTYGDLLRAFRTRAGLTQEALAERAGVAVRSIPGLEAGKHRPQRGTLIRLCQALRLPPDDRRRLENAVGAAARTRATDPRGDRLDHVQSLPSQLSSFVGRDEELAALVDLLTPASLGSRLVTLTGPGGCGKTRLALESAHQVADRYEHGACFVDLGPVAHETLVARTLMAVLGLHESADRSTIHGLIEHLRSREILLVLDNCEHLLAGCVWLVDALLRGCSRLRILATSREALGITGEIRRQVPPLALPGPERNGHPNSLVEYESIRLFTERARCTWQSHW
jgi:transcriptional regulator with XRE-family HTH domain